MYHYIFYIALDLHLGVQEFKLSYKILKTHDIAYCQSFYIGLKT